MPAAEKESEEYKKRIQSMVIRFIIVMIVGFVALVLAVQYLKFGTWFG